LEDVRGSVGFVGFGPTERHGHAERAGALGQGANDSSRGRCSRCTTWVKWSLADAVAAIVVHFDLLPLRHVIAALAVALCALDAENVELALAGAEDEIGAGHVGESSRLGPLG